MPFEELQHTADWSLRVWAADLDTLFIEAARGMNSLAGIKEAEKPRVERTLSITAEDIEGLLVSFLTELVYFMERDRLAFDQFHPLINFKSGDPCRISITMKGAPIRSMDKAIKAVTYHNLHIRKTTRGYEVEIVFDV